MEKEYNFVKRTQENLDIISRLLNNGQIPPNEFYDFTNLINNCLGLISYVYEYSVRKHITLKRKERIQKVLNNTSFDISKYGKIWICLSMERHGGSELDLPTILYHMRNAICHGHVEPYTHNTSNTIIGAKFWDENNNGRNFEAELTIKEITSFAMDIADSYNQYLKLIKTVNK